MRRAEAPVEDAQIGQEKGACADGSGSAKMYLRYQHQPVGRHGQVEAFSAQRHSQQHPGLCRHTRRGVVGEAPYQPHGAPVHEASLCVHVLSFATGHDQHVEHAGCLGHEGIVESQVALRLQASCEPVLFFFSAEKYGLRNYLDQSTFE